MRTYQYGLIFLLSICMPVNAQNKITTSEIADSQIEAKLSELINDENIQPYLPYFKKTEVVRWQISVPKPTNAKKVQGLIVYISPTDSGKIYEMWRPLLTEKQLIWIAADKAGNGYSAQRRVLQALLAVQLAAQQYSIDKYRIYIAGFSGGGRVASMISPLYPNIFTGAIFMGGANFWGEKTPERFIQMQKNPQVFINGEQDFNRNESKSVRKKFEQAGVEHITFMDVPKLGHMPPDETWLAKAIDYLDNNNASHILKQ